MHDAGDAARVKPSWVESVAPQPRVPQQLAHREAVALAVPPQLRGRQVADVVRVGRALRDGGEPPGEEPQTLSPVRRVRLYPDELRGHPDHAQAPGAGVVRVEEA